MGDACLGGGLRKLVNRDPPCRRGVHLGGAGANVGAPVGFSGQAVLRRSLPPGLRPVVMTIRQPLRAPAGALQPGGGGPAPIDWRPWARTLPQSVRVERPAHGRLRVVGGICGNPRYPPSPGVQGRTSQASGVCSETGIWEGPPSRAGWLPGKRRRYPYRRTRFPNWSQNKRGGRQAAGRPGTSTPVRLASMKGGVGLPPCPHVYAAGRGRDRRRCGQRPGRLGPDWGRAGPPGSPQGSLSIGSR